MDTTLRMYEVSLRDGLQNEDQVVPTATKVALAERLVQAGFRDIEFGSFVSPRHVPQMADTDELFQRLPERDRVRYWALVPNSRGLDRALDAGVGHIATFLSASETHNLKNVNRTIRESLADLRRVVQTASAQGMRVRSYISTVFGCPYEGEIPVERTLELAHELLQAGAHEIALGDTTGMATPAQVQHILRRLEAGGIDLDLVACHFHDTRGTAVANAWAAHGVGIRSFDGSIGGIGGCPYAPGASGNASTEDLLHTFAAQGENTGIDLDQTCEAAAFMERALGRALPGRFLQYWKARDRGAARDQQAESDSQTASA
ncbi:MAG: hydroxymethylglutaryl-CoA lyase [Deltaproteobacteria bacterium]|nr:MAG: hydroxymethylglutaryl-CoA lyase [Deltaproteobacteria bacterium]